jgi:hypothetical protein
VDGLELEGLLFGGRHWARQKFGLPTRACDTFARFEGYRPRSTPAPPTSRVEVSDGKNVMRMEVVDLHGPTHCRPVADAGTPFVQGEITSLECTPTSRTVEGATSIFSEPQRRYTSGCVGAGNRMNCEVPWEWRGGKVQIEVHVRARVLKCENASECVAFADTVVLSFDAAGK